MVPGEAADLAAGEVEATLREARAVLVAAVHGPTLIQAEVTVTVVGATAATDMAAGVTATVTVVGGVATDMVVGRAAATGTADTVPMVGVGASGTADTRRIGPAITGPTVIRSIVRTRTTAPTTVRE